MSHRGVMFRAFLILFLLAGLLAGSLTATTMSAQAASHAASLHAASPGDVVISEFRTRGTAGADDEFVELYNRTALPIDISGWLIEVSDNSGVVPFSPLVTIGSNVTLHSGQHFLAVGSGYSGSRPADASFEHGLSIDDNGSIALFDPSDPSTPIAIDQVGMSINSAFNEPPDGSKILTPLSADVDQSYERRLGGAQDSCVDTDKNADDFFLLPHSDPQNLNSPLSLCGAALPTLTPTYTPTNTPTNPSANSSTPTPTSTSTPTNTISPVCSLTPPAAYPSLALVINEVGWPGTLANSADQWIELYNPGPCPIGLSGWRLLGMISGSTQFTIDLNDSLDPLANSILSGGYFVLAVSNSVFTQNVLINQTSSSLSLLKTTATPGETLQLFGPDNELVDHANINGDSWPAGSSSTRASMERSGVVQDVRTNWITYAGPTTNIKDSGSNYVRGTPGRANWASTVTITPSPFKTPTKKPTPRPPTPFAHVVINEFLPRPGFDWNNDGSVNDYDEFIEIENLGPIDVNLSGWKLDNDSGGSHLYSLPAGTLKSGQRALYYGSVTKIPLFDSGGTVRLINSKGVVVDARGYGAVKYPDQTHCRLPDGDGYWTLPCFPTPGLENVRTGSVPALPPESAAGQPPLCLLPDTVPPVFREPVCHPYGADVWNGSFWDDPAGQLKFPVQDIYNKWLTFVE